MKRSLLTVIFGALWFFTAMPQSEARPSSDLRQGQVQLPVMQGYQKAAIRYPTYTLGQIHVESDYNLWNYLPSTNSPLMASYPEFSTFFCTLQDGEFEIPTHMYYRASPPGGDLKVGNCAAYALCKSLLSGKDVGMVTKYGARANRGNPLQWYDVFLDTEQKVPAINKMLRTLSHRIATMTITDGWEGQANILNNPNIQPGDILAMSIKGENGRRIFTHFGVLIPGVGSRLRMEAKMNQGRLPIVRTAIARQLNFPMYRGGKNEIEVEIFAPLGQLQHRDISTYGAAAGNWRYDIVQKVKSNIYKQLGNGEGLRKDISTVGETFLLAERQQLSDFVSKGDVGLAPLDAYLIAESLSSLLYQPRGKKITSLGLALKGNNISGAPLDSMFAGQTIQVGERVGFQLRGGGSSLVGIVVGINLTDKSLNILSAKQNQFVLYNSKQHLSTESFRSIAKPLYE